MGRSERVLTLLAAGAILVGSFMPWVQVGIFTISGTSGDGVLTAILALVLAGFAFARNQRAAGTAVIAISVSVLWLSWSAFGRLTAGGIGSTGTVGVGLLLVMFASLFAILPGLVALFGRKAVEPGLAPAPVASGPPAPPVPTARSQQGSDIPDSMFGSVTGDHAKIMQRSSPWSAPSPRDIPLRDITWVRVGTNNSPWVILVVAGLGPLFWLLGGPTDDVPTWLLVLNGILWVYGLVRLIGFPYVASTIAGTEGDRIFAVWPWQRAQAVAFADALRERAALATASESPEEPPLLPEPVKPSSETDELERLTELHHKGALSAEEFEVAKKRVLGLD